MKPQDVTAAPQAPRRFEARGPLAIRPMAMFELFAPPVSRDIRMAADDRVAVVSVDGPLCQSGNAWEDGYDAIRERFACALATPTVRAVVLKLNSPGGVLYGAIDTARGLRAMADAAGKPFIAYVGGEAASAAYALAVAADRIFLATNAVVGSIGVIEARPDVSVANAARGVAVTLITSGTHKTYGHPETPLTETEHANTQALVNALAVPFFELVAARRQIPVEQVSAYDGGLFTGPGAVTARLADQIMSFDAVVASLAQGTGLPMNYAEIVAALQATAEGDDPNAASARRMLAAMENPEGEPDGDEAEPKPKPEGEDDAEDPEAEDPAEEPAAEDEAPKPAAATVSTRTAQDLASQLAAVSARLNRVEREREQDQIDRLLTGHPKALRAALRNKPLADVQAIVAAIPKPGRLPPVATLSSPHGTPDVKPRKPAVAVDPALARRIDRLTGTVPKAQKRVTKLVNGTLFFDVPEDYSPDSYGQA
jgi:signal peptide peptidase SppA